MGIVYFVLIYILYGRYSIFGNKVNECYGRHSVLFIYKRYKSKMIFFYED